MHVYFSSSFVCIHSKDTLHSLLDSCYEYFMFVSLKFSVFRLVKALPLASSFIVTLPLTEKMIRILIYTILYHSAFGSILCIWALLSYVMCALKYTLIVIIVSFRLPYTFDPGNAAFLYLSFIFFLFCHFSLLFPFRFDFLLLLLLLIFETRTMYGLEPSFNGHVFNAYEYL